jgi:hypothetical protein
MLDSEDQEKRPVKPKMRDVVKFPKPEVTPSEPAQAVFWGVSISAVQRWKREKAPLDSTESMIAWLSNKKRLTDKCRARIAQVVKEAANELDAPESEPERRPVRPPEAQGAGAALRRLEAQETMSYERFIALTQAKVLDHAAIKAAREEWLKIGDALRKYDLMVEANRRDSGELLPRAEWARMARAIVFWWNHGINRAMDEVCERCVNLPDAVAAWKILDAHLVARWGEAFSFACQRDSSISLPKWAVDEVMAALRIPISSSPIPKPVYFDPY